MLKITPFLWFDDNAEEAVNFYTSIFNKNSNVGTKALYDEEGAKASGKQKGTVMVVPFQLNGQEFIALNGGPQFKFNEAVSFVVNCETQEEVDYYWEKLSQGGQESQCGWLKDKYGLSWQVVPTILSKLLSSGNAAKSQRVMHAMLQMKKIDIPTLQKAAEEQ